MTAPFPALLARALRTDPGRPLLTFYDLASGERVELSVTTYANWVAKASGLLVDEHGLERGDTLRVDLPAHWLAAVFAGAAWNCGLVLTDDDAPSAVVTGPESLARWEGYAGGPVLACSLLPLGVRFAAPLPPEVHDVGVEIWSQPDGFSPWDPPTAEDAATRWTGIETTQVGSTRAGTTQAELDTAAAPWHGRLLSRLSPASLQGAASVWGPLATGGSLVLVTGDDPVPASLIESERVTGDYPIRS
ncbi:MAG: TIGR03089 family protein [Nocardioides sp.]|uniref:TIGR03089 family protein n=1 Tax=Nocardioides sp. TaxID=35761 RepID=UPI0039E606DF